MKINKTWKEARDLMKIGKNVVLLCMDERNLQGSTKQSCNSSNNLT